MEVPVPEFFLKGQRQAWILYLLRCLPLDLFKYIPAVFVQLVDRENVAWVEGQSDHGPDFVKIDDHCAVIPGCISRVEQTEIIGTSVYLIIFFDRAVSPPYGREAGCLCRHNIYAVSEFHRQAADSRAYKLQDLVLDETILEDCSYKGKCDVLRAYSRTGRTLQVDCDDLGPREVIGMVQKLLHQFRAAFPDAHRSKCPITGVAVRTENHFPAPRHHFTNIGMYNSHVRRHELTSELFCSGEPVDMVVLVYRPADST